MNYSPIQFCANFFSSIYRVLSDGLSSICSRVSQLASSIFEKINKIYSNDPITKPLDPLRVKHIQEKDPKTGSLKPPMLDPEIKDLEVDKEPLGTNESIPSISSTSSTCSDAFSLMTTFSTDDAGFKGPSSRSLEETGSLLKHYKAYQKMMLVTDFKKKQMREVIKIVSSGDKTYAIEFAYKELHKIKIYQNETFCKENWDKLISAKQQFDKSLLESKKEFDRRAWDIFKGRLIPLLPNS